MSHRFTALHTHLVFSTKERFPFLDRELTRECHSYIGGIIEHIGGHRLEIGGAADHLHILFDMPATASIAECVRTIKANSSKWIHEKWPRLSKFAWQMGYSAFSVSRSGIEDVRRYVRGQEEHHRGVSYQDEVRQFLREYGMECDERYMWE